MNAPHSVQRPFQRLTAADYVCHTWFERDRAHVRLESPYGKVVFELWDEAVFEAIEDGFLVPPHRPRPSGADWQPAAVQYAVDVGLLSL